MLSKHTFLPTKSLFFATGIAACSIAAVGQSANALDLTFSSQSGSNYTYGIQVGSSELVENGDVFTFSGLSGVTNISVRSGTSLEGRIAATSFSSNSATFTAIQNFGNVGFPVNFTELIITSTDAPGTVNWI